MPDRTYQIPATIENVDASELSPVPGSSVAMPRPAPPDSVERENLASRVLALFGQGVTTLEDLKKALASDSAPLNDPPICCGRA